MTNVIDINTRRDHTAGPVICLDCGHKWVDVIPVGRVVVRCPACDLEKGVREGLALTESVLACEKCDNTYFAIDSDTEVTYCVVCGEILDL